MALGERRFANAAMGRAGDIDSDWTKSTLKDDSRTKSAASLVRFATT
jgi:hypothetical protein